MKREDWEKSDPEEWKNWKEAGDKIVWIPIENIVQSRWFVGVRDKEKFEEIKINIATNGLYESLQVRPIENEKFEIISGDHRNIILRDFGWKMLPCLIEELPDKEAREKNVSNNIARKGYNGFELETIAVEFKKSNDYKSDEEIGKHMGGISKQRVGQLLESHEIRERISKIWDESKVTLLKISPNVILGSRPLIHDADKMALLKSVLKGRIPPSKVKKVAEVLQTWSVEPETEEFKNQVLYHNVSYDSVIVEYNRRLEKATKMDRTKRTSIKNPDFIFTMYERLNENLHICLSMLNDGDVEGKKLASNYLKATVGLMLENMDRYKIVNREKIQQVKDILGLHRPTYRNYDGGQLGGIEEWGGKK